MSTVFIPYHRSQVTSRIYPSTSPWDPSPPTLVLRDSQDEVSLLEGAHNLTRLQTGPSKTPLPRLPLARETLEDHTTSSVPGQEVL